MAAACGGAVIWHGGRRSLAGLGRATTFVGQAVRGPSKSWVRGLPSQLAGVSDDQSDIDRMVRVLWIPFLYIYLYYIIRLELLCSYVWYVRRLVRPVVLVSSVDR